MDVEIGDEITIDSEKVGRPPRVGEILEVLFEPYGTRYRVLWNDGHESTIHPTAGSARIRQPGRSELFATLFD